MTQTDLSPALLDAFADRRARVTEALGDGVMVLPASPVQLTPGGSERPYIPDRELYYLSGAIEPESVLVLVGGDEPHIALFVRDRDATAELWSGARLGPDGAAERLGIEACHPLADLEVRLPELLQQGDRIHYRLGGAHRVEALVRSALGHARARGARKGTGPRGVIDPGQILDEMRLLKDATEVERLREAGRISCEGHHAAAAAIGPGVGEWSVQADLEAAFRRAGARGPGYESIVGSGANACVLHYVTNDRVIEEGDLVLIDAGAEFDFYQGDVTRTYPASGAFTSAQADVYDLVERARAAAVEAVRPGVTIESIHEVATSILAEGLVELGVMEGDPVELVTDGEHKAFFPHQTSHWLGLDVHDPGDYATAGASRELKPGMVFTVEPGLYFQPGAGTDFEGIGVRIEDDVLVTEDGHELLTPGIPSDRGEIEALTRG